MIREFGLNYEEVIRTFDVVMDIEKNLMNNIILNLIRDTDLWI
jgi:hypothetical protein